MSKQRVPRTRNCNTLTDAGFRAMIMSMIRKKSMQWKPAQQCIKDARRGKMINASTGRVVNSYECAACNGLFKKDDVKADHISPVIPLTGFDNWDNVIARLYSEDGFQCLCEACHHEKTQTENEIRRNNKRGNDNG